MLGRDARQGMRRLARALALAGLFGAAFGARYGPLAAAVHALGVPLAFVAIASFAAPAFYIALWHLGAEIEAGALAQATVSGVEDAGRLLGGMAPGMLLFGTTLESRGMCAFFAAGGLTLAVSLGLRTMTREVRSAVASPGATRVRLATWPFYGFALLLAARVWWGVLPALGGAT
ncbi:MAG: hypothetical protein R3B13_05635 [Polyangiaceae bacterium]